MNVCMDVCMGMTKAVQESMHLNQYNERAQKKGEIYSQDTKKKSIF